jgi:hypothetical protein
MARIVRWKEKLALGFVALLLSVARGWLPGTRGAASHEKPLYSRLLVATSPKMAFGLELMGRKPYVRLARASLVPVQMPLAAGAFVAMAGAEGAGAASSCSDGGGGGGGTTGGHECWTMICGQSFQNAGDECLTCGYGTCDGACGYEGC